MKDYTASNSDISFRSSNRVWYQLKAVGKDGLESTVGDSLEGSSYAEAIRQQMIAALDSRWKPSAVTLSPKPSKVDKLKGVTWL
ncbi:MAG TPA: hypothetical protein EYG68_02535 [Leucothrix mucor]|nr:hypothetical protein [Leucothrix mucor]